MNNDAPATTYSGLAITSLICGILGFFTFSLTSIPAIICGSLALRNGQSKGMAVAGLITGSISLVIILFVITIATLSIPNLMESRITANEAAASATLKSGIYPSQVQFQAGNYQDADENHVGEYGLLGELTGRTRTNKIEAGLMRLLSGPLTSGPGFTANGYNYAIYLPDGASAISDASDLQSRQTSKMANADDQEQYWVAYAWPVSSETGRRTFAICQDGQVRYSPVTGAPAKAPVWNVLFGGTNNWNQPTWPTIR